MAGRAFLCRLRSMAAPFAGRFTPKPLQFESKISSAAQELENLRVFQRFSGLRSSILQRSGAALEALRPPEATALRMEAFLRRNRLVILSVFGAGAVVCLWRFGNLLVGVSSGSSSLMQIGVLFIVASSVAGTALILRTRYAVNPDAVHRVVMHKLQNSPGFMEIVGKPLVGGKTRAYFISGGSLKLSELKPKLSSQRCFIVFPVQGYDRRALISSEIVKDKGQYDVKLLVADVFMDHSDIARFHLACDNPDFEAPGGVLDELRDPIFKALEAQQEFDALDDMEAKQRREDWKKWMTKTLTFLRRLQTGANSSNQPSLAR